jgi:hypothetical protein
VKALERNYNGVMPAIIDLSAAIPDNTFILHAYAD